MVLSRDGFFLHVPMSDIDSTKNTDNQYSLPFLLSYQTKVIALQQHVKLYSMPIVVVAWDSIMQSRQLLTYMYTPMKP